MCISSPNHKLINSWGVIAEPILWFITVYGISIGLMLFTECTEAAFLVESLSSEFSTIDKVLALL